MFEAIYLCTIIGLCCFGIHRLILLKVALKHLVPSDNTNAQTSTKVCQETPRVTVQLPIYNEKNVAVRLINAVCELDYAMNALDIQVLDDSTDQTRTKIDSAVVYWQRRGRQISVIRRDNRNGFKAGALAAGLEFARGEFIAVFDADFIPTPHFLKRALREFTSAKIGMVQARWAHHNRHDSLLTEAQAILLDGHFSIEQKARNDMGVWFNFNGTAGVWRRTCIEDGGGWAHETLTEDLDLSYRSQMKGWQFKYVDSLSVPAELPSTLGAFRSQQHRWAKGSIQVAQKLLPKIINGPYPFRQKFEATCHLLANLNYLFVSTLCLCLPFGLIQHEENPFLSWMGVTLFLAGSCCFGLFYIGSQKGQQPLARALLLMPLVFAVGISLCVNNTRAVIEAMLGHQSPFVRTPKSGNIGSSKPIQAGYVSPVSRVVFVLEMGVTVLYLAVLCFCIKEGRWHHIPLITLFIAGFSASIWCQRSRVSVTENTLGTAR